MRFEEVTWWELAAAAVVVALVMLFAVGWSVFESEADCSDD